MAFSLAGLTLGRGRVNNFVSDSGLAIHTYLSESDDLATIGGALYFPDFLGASNEDVKLYDLLRVRDSTQQFQDYYISSLSPLTLMAATVASNPFNQSLNTTDPATFASVDTGQGANQLYAMNQPVQTTDDVTFAQMTLTTGLLLPTTGGTPALFDHYEKDSFTVTWTGAFSVDQPGTIWYTRTGDVVNMVIDNENAVQGSSGTIFTLSPTAVPIHLRPSVTVYAPMADAMDNGVAVAAKVQITSGGRILLLPVSGSFSGTGNVIWNDFSFSYIII
jgi:hypothetical protein